MADAHPGAADDLLVGERRVDGAADLVGVGELQHAHLAGLVVHRDLGHGAGVRLARVGVHLAGLGHDLALRLHVHAAAGDGAAVLEVRGQRHVEDADAAVRRAVHVDAALAVGDEVAGVDLELGGGHLEHHLARLAGGHDDGVADAVGAAAGEGAHAVRAGVGVGGVDHHALVGDAERLGGDLRADGLDALAEVDRGEGDDEAAGGGGVDQRLAGVAAEVHAGGVVDRRRRRVP